VKATFALLPDLQTQNAVMEIAWELFQKRGAGLDVRRLPPHISLKQPFDVPKAILESLGLFVYEQSPKSGEWVYTTYRVKPLAGVEA